MSPPRTRPPPAAPAPPLEGHLARLVLTSIASAKSLTDFASSFGAFSDRSTLAAPSMPSTSPIGAAPAFAGIGAAGGRGRHSHRHGGPTRDLGHLPISLQADPPRPSWVVRRHPPAAARPPRPPPMRPAASPARTRTGSSTTVPNAPGPRLVVEERADRRHPVAEQPQQREVHQRQRQLRRHRPPELVGRRHLDLHLLVRPHGRPLGVTVTRRSRSTRTSILASSNRPGDIPRGGQR